MLNDLNLTQYPLDIVYNKVYFLIIDDHLWFVLICLSVQLSVKAGQTMFSYNKPVEFFYQLILLEVVLLE